MFKRFFSTLSSALAGLLLCVPLAAQATPLRSPVFYAIDSLNLQSSPGVNMLSLQQYHDVGTPGQTNFDGWTCHTSDSYPGGSCDQLQISESSQGTAYVKVKFRKQGGGGNDQLVAFEIYKAWVSTGVSTCSLGSGGWSMNYNPIDHAPTGDCSALGLVVVMQAGTLAGLSAGTWNGELDLDHWKSPDGHTYSKVDESTITFTIDVTDNDQSSLSTSDTSISFRLSQGAEPGSVTGTGSVTLYLYNPQAGSMQLRIWDDLTNLSGRSPSAFSIANLFGYTALPTLQTSLEYTVALSSEAVPVPPVVNNGQINTFQVPSSTGSGTVCMGAPAPPPGENCLPVKLTTTLSDFSAVTKAAGFYLGTLHIAFGRAL